MWIPFYSLGQPGTTGRDNRYAITSTNKTMKKKDAPMILEMFVALLSVSSLTKNSRTMSCSVTAAREFKPEEMVLKKITRKTEAKE